MKQKKKKGEKNPKWGSSDSYNVFSLLDGDELEDFSLIDKGVLQIWVIGVVQFSVSLTNFRNMLVILSSLMHRAPPLLVY